MPKGSKCVRTPRFCAELLKPKRRKISNRTVWVCEMALVCTLGCAARTARSVRKRTAGGSSSGAGRPAPKHGGVGRVAALPGRRCGSRLAASARTQVGPRRRARTKSRRCRRVARAGQRSGQVRRTRHGRRGKFGGHALIASPKTSRARGQGRRFADGMEAAVPSASANPRETDAIERAPRDCSLVIVSRRLEG